jgi:hypothetical protein
VITDKNYIIETGLYNLTKDEVPVLVHISPTVSGQGLLVRIKNSDTASPTS